MDVATIGLLFGAALLAGALNAVAGGGSFFTFPALVFSGVNEILANATNSVALWPGAVASVGGYRKDLAHVRRVLVILSIASLIGGAIGAYLLLSLRGREEVFRLLVPWLLLVAVLLFAFGGRFTRWLRSRDLSLPSYETPGGLGLLAIMQGVISIYGGFFGGGMGVMMLAAYTLSGLENIHHMNAIKALVSVFIKGIAVVLFVLAGEVQWDAALIMTAGAVVGGYGGAYYGRMVKPDVMRQFVLVVASIITVVFFVRTYG